MNNLRLRHIALLGVLVLGACSAGPGSQSATPAVGGASPTAAATPSRTSEPSPAASDTMTPPTTGQPTPNGTLPPTDPPAAVIDEPWATAALTDVASGETFSVADLVAGGKVVFLEPMAIWCSNCRAQQATAVEAFASLDPDVAEWIGVDVETTETAEALARYRDQYGFPFRYVISDTALSRALVDSFGEVVLSPPSVNVIVIAPDGEVTHMLGHHSAAEIVQFVQERIQ